ncbi:RHS repeat-associated core domain-containing protein, partial [Salmonella enterica]|nr:RHS repeat-associated core domain-containing protein [Salmonella enterica]
LDQMDRSYTYKDKLLTSFSETTTGQDAKSFTQSIHSYDSLGLYPEAIDMSVETQPGVQTDLFHYFGYDGLGRLNARVYPDQSYVTYEYDLLSRMTSEQFTNQDQTRTTSYAYDDSTRKVTVTLPDGSKSFTHFTPYGDVEYKGQIDVNGKIRPLLYNTYALNGNHLSTSEPFAIKDRAINYHYNEDGSLLLKDDPLGDTVFLKANSMRDGDRYIAAETILTINPNGLHSTQYYDQYGQLAKESSRTEDRTQELVTSYERDEFGQVMGKKQIDQRGEERAWEFRYTTNGNLVYLLDPEKNSYYYEYDAYGNLATVTENSTLTTKNHYNALSWKISEQDVPSGAKESYIYNVNGKPASFIDKAGNRLEYTYTPFYDLSSLITKNASGTIKNKETTEYFPHTSLVKRETNSNGANVDPSSNNFREISYNYDSHNRLTGIRTFGRDYVLGYSDRDDVIDELTYPDGMKVTYSYDAGERLQEVRSPMTGVIRYDYRIDNKGDSYHVEYPNGRTTDKVYDSFGQATKMTQSLNGAPIWKESNQYAFGNIINIQRNDTSYQFDYDKTDRLTRESQSDQTNLYSYDQRGNRSAFEGETKSATGSVAYTFDERNRLRGITNEQTADSETYTYYGDGLRATKAGNDSETKYVYVNGKVIEELDGSGNVKARNIWGNELLFRKDFEANKSGYYGYNSHGDVVVISDENGHEINTYDYDVWGNIVSETEGMKNPFKYSGEIYDEKTGLYYLRARYYDPSLGRFISEDTYKGQVDNPLSLNRYTYVENNPLRYKDPTGHWKDGDEYIQGSTRDNIALWTDVWEKANDAGNKQRMQFAETQADNARNAYWSNLGASV